MAGQRGQVDEAVHQQQEQQGHGQGQGQGQAPVVGDQHVNTAGLQQGAPLGLTALPPLGPAWLRGRGQARLS